MVKNSINPNNKPKKPNQKPLTLQPLTFAQAIQKAVNTKIVIAENKKKA